MTEKIEKDKRVQVKIDKAIADQAEAVFSEVGLTPTTAINAFYRKVISTGGIPFDLTMSQEEKDAYDLKRLTKNTPVIKLDTKKKLEDWFNDPRYDY